MSGEELKAVAWRYEKNGVVALHSCRKPLYLTPGMGEWTETPLYAHPLPEQPREGWQLVPVEITQAMLDATCCDEADDRQMRDAWKALLAAAPTPPSTETKESGDA